MEHKKAINESRKRKLVPDDKFDRHMRRARLQDMSSRKKIFDGQTENGLIRMESRKQLTISTY
jgi:hypothetical protein